MSPLLLVLFGLLLNPFPLNAHQGESHSAPPQAVPQALEKTLNAIAGEYEGSVRPIFEKSCFDCHSGATRYPWYYRIPGIKQMIDEDVREAKKHLDMSAGFPFQGHGTPAEDLEQIREVVEDQSMPPTNYLWMHWKASLSESDRERVLQWVSRSLQTLANPQKVPGPF